MAKTDWRDTSSYSQGDKVRTPWCFEIKLGDETLVVHRHRDYGPDVWLSRFKHDGLSRPLASKDIEAAMVEALERVAVWADRILTDARRAQT